MSCLLKIKTKHRLMNGRKQQLTVAPTAALSNFESISETINPYKAPFIATVKLHFYVGWTEDQFSAFCLRRTLSRWTCKFQVCCSRVVLHDLDSLLNIYFFFFQFDLKTRFWNPTQMLCMTRFIHRSIFTGCSNI